MPARRFDELVDPDGARLRDAGVLRVGVDATLTQDELGGLGAAALDFPEGCDASARASSMTSSWSDTSATIATVVQDMSSRNTYTLPR